jgi:translocation and assembly module TamB
MSWKTKLGWTALIIVCVVVIVGITGVLVLRSRGFHRWVLAKIEQTASDSIGGRVEIQNYTFSFSRLTADAYGITVHGTETKTAKPLLQADQLQITLKVVSLLHKKVDLKEIIVRHPVVNLLARKDGTTNLPHAPQKSNSSTSIWDLGIQHVLLSNGEVYYNDVKTPLDADLHDLQFEVRSQGWTRNYRGSLSYRDGHLQYGTFKPLPHDLNARFTANPSQFNLQPLVLRLASSTLQLDGHVQNYSNPLAAGHYKITMYPQDFRAALQNPDIPTGEITLAGSLRYQYEAKQPLLRTLIMDGQLNSRELAVNTPDLRTVVRNLAGKFRLANGNLAAKGFVADVFGGHLMADATMQHMDTNPVSRLHASLQALSLAEARAALKTGNFQQLPITGHVDGTADASWAGTIANLKAHSDLALKAALSSAQAGAAPIPLDGAVHVTYARKPNLATLTNTFIRTPRTRLNLNGTAGRRLNLQVLAHAADLRELDTLAAALQKASPQTAGNTPPASSINLAGAADAQITVQGTTDNPQIRGQIKGSNLQVKNSQWRSLQLAVQAGKSGITIQNGSLVNARQGYLNFDLSAQLTNWHYEPANALNAQVKSRGIAISQLLQLANLNYPVTGNLATDISVHGSQLNPVGNGSIRLLQAKIYGQPMQTVSLQFTGNGNAVNSTVTASMPAGFAKADVVLYPKTKGYELRLNVPGIKLAQLQPVQEKNLQLQGVLTATASGRGTFDNPQLAATVQVPQLQMHQASLSGIKAQLEVANHKAELALDSEVAQSFVQARGTVDLTDGYYTRATFDTRALPIQGLIALYEPVKTNGPTGTVELHASLDGPLNNKDRIQAQLVIPTFNASYQGLQIGNKNPIRVHYANSLVTVEPTEIAGTDTDLRIQGQLAVRGNAPMTLSAVGDVDMKLLRFFQSDLQSYGKLLLDVRATGAAGHPTLQGQLRIQDVTVMPPDAPVGVEHLNGVLDVHNNEITITQLSGQSGGGQISATGVVGYRPQLQMNVVMKAQGVRIRYQDAIRTVVDSDLNLVGTSAASTLSGRVIIDSLGFTQSNLDLTQLAGAFQTGTETAPSQGFEQNLKLNITVESSQNLNLTSSAVSLEGSINLRVVGTAADPVIVGRTSFNKGEVFLMSKRFQIQPGSVISFNNPNQTEPVLNVRLGTRVDQYDLTLNFIGPLDKMRTNYISDPPLATADVINLLVRGQTVEQAEAAPSNFGATSLLAEGAASQVSSGIQKLAGLSSFSIDPTLGGNDPNPGARIALQKRLSKNFFFTFATDVTSAQREIIQGEYQFNKRWSATVTRDENGGFAVDGKFHTTF